MQYLSNSVRNIINAKDVDAMLAQPEQINEYSLLYAIQSHSYQVVECMLEVDEDLLFKLVEECVRISNVSNLLWVIELRKKTEQLPSLVQKKFNDINWNVSVNEITPLTLLILSYDKYIIMSHIEWLLFCIKVKPSIREAIKTKNNMLVKRILDTGIVPQYEDLVVTLHLGYDSMFKMLIDSNAPLHSPNKQDHIVNHLTRRGHTKLLEYILACRDDSELPSNYMCTHEVLSFILK